MRTRTQNLLPMARRADRPARALGAVLRDSRERIVTGGQPVCTATRRPSTTRSESVRVFVLPPGAGFGGLGFRCSLEQEVEVRRDERVGRRHGVGVVDGPVLPRERDPARVLEQTVLQLSPDLA